MVALTGRRIIFDIEGNDLYPAVSVVHCISAEDADSDDRWHWGPDHLDEAIASLRGAECLIGHNIIAYDLRAIWKVLGGWDNCPLLVDTLITSRFLWQERPGGHSLEAWGKRLKFPKTEFKAFDKYTPEMGEYCNRDVQLNKRVLKELEEEYGSTLTGFQVFDERTLARASSPKDH